MLVALNVPGAMDPVVEPAFQLLQRRPLRPTTAVKKLSKHTEEILTHHLEFTGQLRRIRLQSRRFTHPYALPLTDRGRVGNARAALLAALFDRTPPAPTTAAIISLLHAVDGLGALLSLNDRGWRWVHARAGEIASGSWVHEYPTAMPEFNLAVTASAVRPALS
jgi:Golgi phosphoprotein 3 (GPP34)